MGFDEEKRPTSAKDLVIYYILPSIASRWLAVGGSSSDNPDWLW
jgi:hypothetical protein